MTEPPRPDWEALLDLAVSQAGYFATSQATELRFSSELLAHHVKSGRLLRARRGVYRVRHLPAQDDEQLVEFWLWSSRSGVFGYETALARYNVCDVFPSTVEMIVPPAWAKRRLRVPQLVNLHFDALEAAEQTWIGHAPVTSFPRTFRDCERDGTDPSLLRQAAAEAVRRGLVTSDALTNAGAEDAK